MKTALCQATQSAPVETEVASQSPDGPYRLCSAAAHRLLTRSLRPLEWFRLAVIHSPREFLLHDDFYDENGSACCPEEPVVDATSYPFPQIHEVAHDPELLLDFAIVRPWLGDPELEALKKVPADILAEAVQARRRSTSNIHIIVCLYGICGQILGPRMAVWVRNEVSSNTMREDRLALLTRAGACLPTAEAKKLARDELASLRGKELVHNVFVLAQFRDESTLDWIEENVCEPLTQPWGDLAAVAGITWSRIAKWLDSGRPLSLVAMDALVACDAPRRNQSLLVQKACPRLLGPPGEGVISERLKGYLVEDSSPRVRKAVERISQAIQNITRPGSRADANR